MILRGAPRRPPARVLVYAALLAACSSSSLTPITVTINRPADEAQVASLVTVSAGITGGTLPITATFRVSKTAMRVKVTDPPYKATLDLSPVPADRATIIVDAVDAKGVTGSARVAVKIDREVDAGDAPPSIRLIYPVAGAAVCGTLDVEATAADDQEITRVRFYLDGASTAEATAPPYRWSWNTASAKAGPHVIKAEAVDSARRSVLDTIAVEVKPSSGACDNLPSVALSEPLDGAVVRGRVPLSAQAGDDVGVTGVQFFVDGSLLAEDKEVPFKINWDSDGFPEGAHLLRAVAKDTGGQIGKQEVGVTIDRTPPKVDFVDLEAGARLEGTVTVKVEASDQFGLYGVRLGAYRNGSLVEMVGAYGAAPFEFEWDTSAQPPGAWELRADARDRGGLVASASRRVVLGAAVGEPCTAGDGCETGQCYDGVCCDTACTGTCRSCALTGSVGTCRVVSGAEDPGSCDGKSACSASGQCLGKNGATCSYSSQCASGTCADGVCCGDVCSGTCRACNLPGKEGSCAPIISASDPLCAGTCDATGACVRSNGMTCSSGTGCASGFCVEGVCCESACAEACHSCAVSGSAGKCVPARAGYPDRTCVAPNACDTAGACKKGSGQACSAAGECASGFCADGVCCSSECKTACSSCSLPGYTGSCRQVYNAPDPDSCPGTCSNYGTCVGKGGTACTTASQCGTGYCVDGVCCDNACQGSCRSCALPGLAGTCSPVMAAADADTCTGDRACDGTGACKCTGGACTPVYGWTAVYQNGLSTGSGRVTALAALGASDLVAAGQWKGRINLDPRAGQSDVRLSDAMAGFVTRVDAGRNPVWSRVLGGGSTGTVYIMGAGTTASAVYVAGSYTGLPDLDPGPSFTGRTASGMSDGFVVKLDASGTFQWSRYLAAADGATVTVRGFSVAPDGSLLVIGELTGSADLDPDAGTQTRSDSDGRMFILKLTADGAFVWARQVNASSSYAYQVKAAADGSVVYGGQFKGTVDLDPTAGTDMRTSAGDSDAFVTKLSADGSYQWSRTTTSTGGESGVATVLSDGTVGLAGSYSDSISFQGEIMSEPPPAPVGGYLVRYGASGTYLGKSLFPSTSFLSPRTLGAAGPDGFLMGGFFGGTADFDPGAGKVEKTKATFGIGQAFMARYKLDGSLAWVLPSVGVSSTGTPLVVVLGDGAHAVGESFSETFDFDPGPGVDSRSATFGDAFITRFVP